MKHEIIHKLDTPIAVLDSAYDMVYKNEKLSVMLDDISEEKCEDLLSGYRQGHYNKQQEVKCNNKDYIMYIKTLASFKETEHILIIRDITNYRAIEKELNSEQVKLNKANDELLKMIDSLKELSKVGARNFVARELHDIVGHSLVVAIKLLEVADLYKDDDSLSKDALLDAVKTLNTGISEMKSIKEPEQSVYTGDMLRKEILKMLDHFGKVNIETSLSFKGQFYKLEEHIFLMIKKICTELTTNSLKHSRAEKLFISIKIHHDEVDLLVIDNGVGQKSFSKGNGLKGIEERLKVVNGHATFNTSENEGFISKIIIPINNSLKSK